MTRRGDLPLPPRAGPIVDANGCIAEPASAWAALPESIRPRISADSAGDEHVIVGDTEVLAGPPDALTRPVASDTRARRRAMDSEGLDQAVLHSTIGLSLSSVEDPAAAVALAAASNDWLSGFCAADPRRLFGAAVLPLQHPAAAARELRRAVGELGLVAGLVHPGPWLGRSLADRAYDVVWEAAEELTVPIGVHEGRPHRLPTDGTDRPGDPQLNALSSPFEAMRACAQLLTSGTLERHPGLRLLFLASGGWVPFWLQRLDEHAASRGFTPDSGRRPSELFARQCAAGFGVDEHTLPALVPFVGRRRAVWGSDSPHRDAASPGAVAAIRATVAPCATATQVCVLGLNARQLYGLPGRRSGLPGLLDDYFAAVTAQEIDLVRALFAPDAVFESGTVRLQGLDAISDYYLSKTFTYDDFRPAPRTPTFEGTSIVVDIDVHLGGTQNVVHDVFETDGTRITALHVSGFEEALASAPR